jgi:hypothetical protein
MGISRGRRERFQALKARQIESVGRLEFDRSGTCVFTPADTDQAAGLRLLAERFNWELSLVENGNGAVTVVNLRMRERFNQREAEWALIKNIRPVRFHNGFADVQPESEAEERGIMLLAERQGWKVRKADDGRLFISKGERQPEKAKS